jgi:hypothetical protein
MVKLEECQKRTFSAQEGLLFHLGERLKKGGRCCQIILIPPEMDTTVGVTGGWRAWIWPRNGTAQGEYKPKISDRIQPSGARRVRRQRA